MPTTEQVANMLFTKDNQIKLLEMHRKIHKNNNTLTPLLADRFNRSIQYLEQGGSNTYRLAVLKYSDIVYPKAAYHELEINTPYYPIKPFYIY